LWTAFPSASRNSSAETFSSAENGARPVATALTLRSSQSGWNLQAPTNAPPVEVRAHHRPGLRPVRADPRQRQVAPGELGAPGVDPVEDVDDDVHGLVGAGDRLDVDVAVEHVARRWRRSTKSKKPGWPFNPDATAEGPPVNRAVTSTQSGSSFILTEP
jgi:hypothetical protein